MKHRKLRIAWSMGSGIACALLIAAAYFFQLAYPPTPKPPLSGRLWDFRFTRRQTLITQSFDDWSGDSLSRYVERRKLRTIDYFGFSRQSTGMHYLWTVPHWSLVVISMVVGYWVPLVISLMRTVAGK